MTGRPTKLLARVLTALFIIQTVLGPHALAAVSTQSISDSNWPVARIQSASTAIESVAIASATGLGIGIGIGIIASRADARSLVRINPAPGPGYLVETDPAFTGYRTWLSSDWMLAQLNLDPERTMKRYGDGFAEQRLVDDQIVQLTGRRFLSNYTSTEDEYQDLLNAGVLFAQQYQLTPGMALSAEQMASLTTDIVWLETQTVLLPDGNTVQALVPQVYLRRPVAGDITPTGALISGSSIQLRNPGGDLSNSGTLYGWGEGGVSVAAANIANSGNVVGNTVRLTATNDINNIGGQITGIGGTSTAVLTAGHNILLKTTTQTSQQSLQGANGVTQVSRTNIDRVATISADSITLAALGNIDLQGASIQASNHLGISATGAITLGTVQEGYTLHAPLGGNVQGRTGHYDVESTTNAGTQISVGGNASIRAGGAVSITGGNVQVTNTLVITGANVTVEAAIDRVRIDQQGVNARGGYQRAASDDETTSGGTISAGNNLSVSASKGITVTGAYLVAGTNYDNTATVGQLSLVAGTSIHVGTLTTHHSDAGEGYSARNGTFSSSRSQTDSASQASLSQGSTISGGSVVMLAGQLGEGNKPIKGSGDITIAGSNIVADNDVRIAAGNNVTITAATNTESSRLSQSHTESGFGTVGDLSYGTSSQSFKGNNAAVTATGSSVGSLYGDVTISAGGAYAQVGSDVLAVKGDITLVGKTVSITEARETGASQSESKFKQSGITLDVSNPVIDALRTTGSLIDAASNTDDPRMKALAAAAGAATLYSAGSQIAANPATATNVGINISYVNNKSESKSQSDSDLAAGSSVKAGGNLSITATGAGADSNILVRGSDLTAGKDAGVKADGKIDLQASKETGTASSSNSNSSFSVGIGLNAGTNGNGVTVNAAASKGNGSSSGDDTRWNNTHVQAGGTLTVQSGGDTTLQGAVVGGHAVKADIGGNLLIESLQDTSTYQQESKNAGFAVSATYGVGGGASVSAGKTDINSTFASVGEQSGIRAGDGGFQVSVRGDADLKGGAITSTQNAVDNNLNVFKHDGALTTSDIHNSASYDAVGWGGTIGVGTMAGNTRLGFGAKDGDASSTTAAAISGVAGDTGARTGDKESGIKPIFDVTRVTDDINAQVTITSAFGRAAAPAVASFADQQAVKARQSKNEEEARLWDEGGAYRVALHAAIGLLMGGVGGAVGGGVTAAAMPVIGEEIANLNLPEPVRQALTQIVGMTLGAVGGTAGAATGGVQTALNYVSHSPFKGVRAAVSKENAKLLDECGASCSLADLLRIDQQLARLETAGNLTAISQFSKLTTEQAIQLGETVASLLPFYGTPIALYQALSGESLSGRDLGGVERFFNGVAAAIPLGSMAARLLNSAMADMRLAASVGGIGPDGRALMDFSMLTRQQKGVIGEIMGASTVQNALPGATRLGRMGEAGSQGIDDLYKVVNANVDYVIVEYKFGTSALKTTADGVQMSDTWILGAGRIVDIVLKDAAQAEAVANAVRAGRIEKWVVHTDPAGGTSVWIVDAVGKIVKADSNLSSKIIGK